MSGGCEGCRGPCSKHLDFPLPLANAGSTCIASVDCAVEQQHSRFLAAAILEPLKLLALADSKHGRVCRSGAMTIADCPFRGVCRIPNHTMDAIPDFPARDQPWSSMLQSQCAPGGSRVRVSAPHF